MKKLTITIAIAALIFGCEKTETERPIPAKPEYNTKVIFYTGEELDPTMEMDLNYDGQIFQLKKWEAYPPYPSQEERMPYFKVYNKIRPGTYILRYRFNQGAWKEKGFILKDNQVLILDLNRMNTWNEHK